MNSMRKCKTDSYCHPRQNDVDPHLQIDQCWLHLNELPSTIPKDKQVEIL